MGGKFSLYLIACLCAVASLDFQATPARAEITAEEVRGAIDRGSKYLLRQQRGDGSWSAGADGILGGHWNLGVTSLTVLALLNSGIEADHPQMVKALEYLRSAEEPGRTYEISLMIMALAAAKDGTRDKVRISKLVLKLENSQIRRGEGRGSWSYGEMKQGRINLGSGDHSNSQYAVLALRDAQDYGVDVDVETWKRVRTHWLGAQNADGGWGYVRQGSTGSMTVAGIATMVIVNSMLSDEEEVDEDGNPICCAEAEEDQYLKSLNRGVSWLAKHFAVGTNPRGQGWLLYYLYGLERAGRLSARRFFGEHDWYREGAEYLVAQQTPLGGYWQGIGHMEGPLVATDFALLFLSKGLAPVLMNKLKFGPRGRNGIVNGSDWDNHHDDVKNLTKLISGLDRWPKLLTWQQVDSAAATVADLRQAPVLFISAQYAYEFTNSEIAKLKEYVNQGGTIFVESCCRGDEFDASFRTAVERMYPDGEAELKELPPEHEIFRSEFRLDPDTVELWGVDLGCRTAIIYSPRDLSCLWDKWRKRVPEGRPPQLSTMINKATHVGVNVVAYATGRELLSKLEENEVAEVGGSQDKVTRGLLQVAKIRHPGSWNTAPSSLRNLLFALNEKIGMVASTKQRNLVAVDGNIFKYPLVYMHGRHSFQLSGQEQESLRKYLEQGGFLFADACCGSTEFDKSFREMMQGIFPDKKLTRLTTEHELLSPNLGGFDIRTVKRRMPESEDSKVTLKTNIHDVEPLLEAIEIEGRVVVVYSKFDISCALERQASVACAGYVHEDAIRIAVNVVLYAIGQ